MAGVGKAEQVKRALEALPEVASVDEIKVEEGIITYVSLSTRALGGLTARQLKVSDAAELFDFYSEGLSEKARRLFAPYPLFDAPPQSADELARKIADWKKEDDWSAMSLVKDGRIVGFALLKRFRTGQVTSGIAVRDEFHRMGLGSLLQGIIVGQARLLGLERFHIKVISDNLASIRLHEKCGFRQTKILPAMYEGILEYLGECDKENGKEPVYRQLIEMVVDLNGRVKP